MLISYDEMARGALILVFGSAAGAAALAFPGTAAWLLPAAIGMAGASFTIPEVRDEVRKSLPGLVDQARAGLPALRLPARIGGSAAPPAGPPARAAGEPEQGRDPLFTALEDSPHRLVIGHTGGGKTTLMHSMAVNWAASKQRVLVLDPDAAPGQWPGCIVRGAGDDYQGISQGLAAVDREVERRRKARAEGQRQFAPAHLIIDEAQDVIAECPGAIDIIESVARRGRKINMRLTMGVQDNQAKTLGIEGKTHLLRNLRTIDVMLQDGRRVAVVHRPGGNETMPIPDLYDPEHFIVTKRRATGTAPSPSPAPEDLLASLLSTVTPESVTRASESLGNASGVTVTVTDGNGNGQSDKSVTKASESDKHAVTVTVNARAEVMATDALPGNRRRARRGHSVNIAARVQRSQEKQYRQAGASGESFRKAYERIGGSRNRMLLAWQEGKQTRSQK